jgi:hypothetical protein
MCREERYLPVALPISGNMVMEWDNRFLLHLTGPKTADNGDTYLQPLGRNGWVALRREVPSIKTIGVPVPVITTLPSLVDNHGILAVPNLNYRRANMKTGSVNFTRAAFHPRQSLSGRGFTVAK